jgi:hypothetical protein
LEVGMTEGGLIEQSQVVQGGHRRVIQEDRLPFVHVRPEGHPPSASIEHRLHMRVVVAPSPPRQWKPFQRASPLNRQVTPIATAICSHCKMPPVASSDSHAQYRRRLLPAGMRDAARAHARTGLASPTFVRMTRYGVDQRQVWRCPLTPRLATARGIRWVWLDAAREAPAPHVRPPDSPTIHWAACLCCTAHFHRPGRAAWRIRTRSPGGGIPALPMVDYPFPCPARQ